MPDPTAMRPRHWAATALGLALLLGGLGAVRADAGAERFRRGPDVAPVTDAAYREECGACHFAYPPGLLPARGWRRVMGGLSDHFGDDASLPGATRDALTAYLAANAADRARELRSVQIARTLPPDAVPMRISTLPLIRRKHADLAPRMVADNPEVGSLARCEACHMRAPEGYYSEGSVRIPGFGRWDG